MTFDKENLMVRYFSPCIHLPSTLSESFWKQLVDGLWAALLQGHFPHSSRRLPFWMCAPLSSSSNHRNRPNQKLCGVTVYCPLTKKKSLVNYITSPFSSNNMAMWNLQSTLTLRWSRLLSYLCYYVTTSWFFASGSWFENTAFQQQSICFSTEVINCAVVVLGC